MRDCLGHSWLVLFSVCLRHQRAPLRVLHQAICRIVIQIIAIDEFFNSLFPASCLYHHHVLSQTPDFEAVPPRLGTFQNSSGQSSCRQPTTRFINRTDFSKCSVEEDYCPCLPHLESPGTSMALHQRHTHHFLHLLQRKSKLSGV
jgi:hypothetical protein